MKNQTPKLHLLKIRIEHATDADPDTSYYGEYGNKATSPATIDREARGDANRNEYRYFNPGMTGDETGNPESPEQDYERMEAYNAGEWGMIGVIAKAEYSSAAGVVQTVRSGGLWGVESDSGAEYLAEVAQEQLAELKAELLAVGFGVRAIAYAFRKVETVNR